jgi:restriction endonuclease S subunit
MPDKLPKGWVETTLGEIARPGRVRVSPREHPELPFIGLEHIESQTMRLLGRGDAGGVRSSSTLFEKGDVLYGKMRPYLNKVWVAEFAGMCSTELLVFPHILELNSTFLALRLNADDFVSFANQQVSGDRPRVNFTRLSAFPIYLPPLAEQGRIVATANESLSRMRASESAARRGSERLVKYRAAVLHAAVSGELTSEWRKTHKPQETGAQLLQRLLNIRRTRWEEAELRRPREVGRPPKDDKWKTRYEEPPPPKTEGLPHPPKEWTWTNLTQLKVYSIYGPRFSRSDYAKNGVAVLRTTDIDERGRVSLESCPKLPLSDNEYEKYKVEKGDLLITRTGSIGTLAIFNDTVRAIPGAYLLHYRLITPPLAEMAYTFLRSPTGRKQLWEVSAGSGRQNLSAPGLESIAIPLPPLDEEAEIMRQVGRRLSAADQLELTLKLRLDRARATRQSLLHEAFTGRLVSQGRDDEPASILLDRIRAARGAEAEARRKNTKASRVTQLRKQEESVTMNQPAPTADALKAAWQKTGRNPDARLLFEAAGFTPEQVVEFYEVLRSTPEIRDAFEAASKRKSRPEKTAATRVPVEQKRQGRFRVVTLWLKDFKNLKDYEVHIDPGYGLDVVLGWNGTGKSNLFEALVIIFRDLHYWWEKNRWPDEPMAAYRLAYEIEEHLVDVHWDPARMKRPEVKMAPLPKEKGAQPNFHTVKREDLRLPRFVFGYYSGPTNRLAEHFLPMKRDHYERLVKAQSDDPETLARLLEQRRFFCAETHHAKYVLLAFSYKEDPKITHFLESRLRILGFESALFVIRRPRWARKGSTPADFWGATGIMLRVMEKLRRFAIAPMVVKQTVSDGYRSTTEDHYFFFLPDLNSLLTFAAEYADARSFFLALESTDFSELIHDVKIQVRVKTGTAEQIPITFHQLSEGEQQLLMVLGLMRFTKSHQSLVLLDEPDTHLNPHWSVDYLRDLSSVISDDDRPSPEQQTSQLLMATHDPLVIASLLKEQVHLLKRNRDSLQCYWEQASESPRGLGFTGILISDMFGFRSDLDEETLALLDRQVQLAGKAKKLSPAEKGELTTLNKQIDVLGFKTASSDPYYRAFIEALSRHQEALALIQKPVQTPEERTRIRQEADKILAELARKHPLRQ